MSDFKETKMVVFEDKKAVEQTAQLHDKLDKIVQLLEKMLEKNAHVKITPIPLQDS